MEGRGEIVYRGEIACYRQFLLSHNVFHSYISVVCQNVALCGNGLTYNKFIRLSICGDNELTLYQTTPTLNALEKDTF